MDEGARSTASFTADRFGLFIHFGLYSLAARHEWVKQRERLSDTEYRSYFDHFDPDLYDPRLWARDARVAGMRYAVITTKHHDGFCLFPTKETDYCVTHTPYGRDLIGPWVDAFRAEGLKVGFYHSVLDWHHPEFPVDSLHPQWDDQEFKQAQQHRDITKYRAYLHAQVRELLTKYGKIDIMWFDFSYPHLPDGKGRDEWDSPGLVRMVRELQPEILINDRLDFPESADFVTPEQFQPDSPPTIDGRPVVWEACQTLNGSWGYDRDNLDWESPELLVSMLIDTVAKGGNLLLNVGPTGRGQFDPRARAILTEIGDWMALHGRAVYEASAANFAAPADCRFTQRGDRFYLFLLSWPFHSVRLPGLGGKVRYAQFLHDGSEVRRDRGVRHLHSSLDQEMGDAETLLLPVQRPDALVPVIELLLEG